MRLRSALLLSTLAASLTFSFAGFSQAQTASPSTQTSVALHPDLLPVSFGDWKRVSQAGGAEANVPAMQQPRFLAEVNQAALEEGSPQSSVAFDYARGGTGAATLRVTALEFHDASGAIAAFSVLNQPDMHEVKGLGTEASTGEGAYLFVSGPEVAIVYPAALVDVPTLKSLEAVMPKVTGSRAMQPLLPTLLPERGLVGGTVRYAEGPRSYMAEGGVLPAAGLGWEKEAEAVTAKYSDRRGAETLTLLLYPTPTIAGPHLRAVEAELAGLGPSFRTAKIRREGSMIVLANGSFSADAAQALVENTHLHQVASTDKATPTPEMVETRQTFGLLANIIVFSGVLGLAAVLLGLFLGGGRALVRVLRGKPAASETEFLSLHLEPQNPTPVFSKEQA